TGLASIPLLLAKLWSVYPKLFTWPPARDVAEALSRLGLLVLVGSAIFQLLSGLVNVARWYAVMPFFFTVAHYWTAWIAIGALVVHVGSKLHIVARSLRHQQPAEATTSRDVLHRRQFLASAGAAAVVVTVATLGQTVPGLRRLSVLAPRDPQFGPAGLPVNKTARSAGVLASARAADYALAVDGPNPLRLSRAELEQLPQHTVELPITCVEGWSATGVWTGVRLRDVLSRSGVDVAGSDAVVRVESLQTGGRYRSSEVSARLAADPLTLLALSLNGQPLDLDHGYPLRLIAPNRPGVLQTKWVGRISVNRPGQP
ncbi:MAG TPA: molybdopterin-dependent oxidoreductase, partial [Dermatophilaceae bacterium]|nr:molybdopterin-dependent oxidoreductase [Dermatophilaceae bacterium]